MRVRVWATEGCTGKQPRSLVCTKAERISWDQGPQGPPKLMNTIKINIAKNYKHTVGGQRPVWE